MKLPPAPTDDLWRLDAECAAPDIDPEMFFPPQGGRYETAEPKRICGRCRVREECFAYAMAHPREQGIWGGTTDHERARLRRRMDRPIDYSRDTAARRIEVEILAGEQLSDGEIAKRLGVHMSTVLKDRHFLDVAPGGMAGRPPKVPS